MSIKEFEFIEDSRQDAKNLQNILWNLHDQVWRLQSVKRDGLRVKVKIIKPRGGVE